MEAERAKLKLSQVHQLTMAGHVWQKMRACNDRLRATWGLPPAEDDMQVLGDVNITEVEKKKGPSKLGPLFIAAALAFGLPTTAGIVMLPSIIAAMKPTATVPQEKVEYAPVLVPGKPPQAGG